MTHLASPRQAAAPLFAAALAESGIPTAAQELFAERQADTFYEKLGCGHAGDGVETAAADARLQCAQAKSLAEVLAAEQAVAPGEEDPLIADGWGPLIDSTDDLMPRDPLLTLRMGEGAQVPVIAGANTNEGTLFVAG